jgi:hypothetical protein
MTSPNVSDGKPSSQLLARPQHSDAMLRAMSLQLIADDVMDNTQYSRLYPLDGGIAAASSSASPRQPASRADVTYATLVTA